MTFRPVFQDTFTSNQLVVEFSRQGRRVSGFRLTQPGGPGGVWAGGGVRLGVMPRPPPHNCP